LTSSIGFAATPTADFDVTFEATWSAETHPNGFPSGPHFSPLVGGIHNSMAVFWEDGGLSTFGMERMAENGATTDLKNEVQSAINLTTALAIISGGGISTSPGSVAVSITASQSFPLLTLVSMLAPSPDWFVGVAGYDLMNGGDWIDTATIDLYAYDAGTDSGLDYTSSNQDTNPQDPIAMINSPPFDGMQVGTFTITRTDSPQAVPALGSIAQWTLGSLMALFGFSRSWRRISAA
jgi:hypothetical protein